MKTETGKVFKILPLLSGGSNGKEWQKKDVVIETTDKYPKKVCYTLWNDKCKIEINIGDTISVEAEAESREYNDKWYNNIKATKVTVLSKAAAPVKNEKPTFETADLPETTEAKDDLPF